MAADTDADDARRAHREQQLVSSFLEAELARIEQAALDDLRSRTPGRATMFGREASEVRTRLRSQEQRVTGLAALVGWAADAEPWSDVANMLRNQLAMEEEMLVRAEDELTNADAYDMPLDVARYNHTRQECRVRAFQTALEAAEKKMARTAGESE